MTRLIVARSPITRIEHRPALRIVKAVVELDTATLVWVVAPVPPPRRSLRSALVTSTLYCRLARFLRRAGLL